MLFLKIFHKFLLLGSPLMTYNPFTNIFNAPFNVQPYSTYLNFKLDKPAVEYLSDYLHTYKSSLNLVPVQLSSKEEPGFFLSLNIYNVTSPLFINSNQPVTRCEINTYVKDAQGNIGTLILDYCSNMFSLDPVNILKFKSLANFKTMFGEGIGRGRQFNFEAVNTNINFNCNMIVRDSDKPFIISDTLVEHTDKIYYKNGIYDKLFYDSSLVHAKSYRPTLENFYFKYKDLVFSNIHSIFYFHSSIPFICSIWHNLG